MGLKFVLFFFVWLATLLFSSPEALAQTEYQFQQPTQLAGIRLAQADGDDSYDPFADYSEFDQASDEEADIHFFKNGRFFTLGFAMGARSFTDNLANLYSSGATYGLYMAYFFDLSTAFQFGFTTGDYAFELNTPAEKLTGNVALTFMSLSLKFYLNTQNVTRGLADLNPYLIGGLSQVYRTYTFPEIDGFGRDSTIGLDGGAGLEIPLMRRKAYFGIQGTYHYVNFKDENSAIVLPSGTQTTAYPRGDTFDVLGILGLNF